MTDVANLSLLANANSHLTRGSRLPHAQIQYWFNDGTNDTFAVDDWTNRDAGVVALLNQALAVAPPIIPPAVVWEAALNWPVETSLLATILNTFYFALAQPANWCDPGGGAGARQTFQLKAGMDPATAPEKELFMHLTSSRAAIYYRESTMATLNLDNIVLSVRAPGAPATVPRNVALNWTKVLHEIRREVRSRLSRRAAPWSYDAAGWPTYDLTIFELLDEKVRGGFEKLITAGVLRREPHGNGYEYINTANAHLGGALHTAVGFSNRITAALNHLRFAMYVEWRVGYELMTGAVLP